MYIYIYIYCMYIYIYIYIYTERERETERLIIIQGASETVCAGIAARVPGVRVLDHHMFLVLNERSETLGAIRRFSVIRCLVGHLALWLGIWRKATYFRAHTYGYI